MRAKEITVGEHYVVEAGYSRRRVKAIVEAAPVQRLVMRSQWRDGKSVRVERPVSDRLDGARVRLVEAAANCEVGTVLYVPLANVIRPWTAEDEAKRVEKVEREVEGDMLAERLRALGVPDAEVAGRSGFRVLGYKVEFDREVFSEFFDRVTAGPLVPEGYRIDRDDERADREIGGCEVRFDVVPFDETGDADVLTTALARFDSRWGEWIVAPGSTTSRMLPDEARARAAVLMMAADEVDRRNAARADT